MLHIKTLKREAGSLNDLPALAIDSKFKDVSKESGILNQVKRFLQIEETEVWSITVSNVLQDDLLGSEDCIRAGHVLL